MINAGQSIFAAVGLVIAIAGLLLLSPSRRLALVAGAIAVAVGLSAAIVLAARTVSTVSQPQRAAPQSIQLSAPQSSQPGAPSGVTPASTGEMAQREQDLIKSWSAKLDAEVLQHKAEIDALSNKIDALSKELAQSQAGLSTQAAERQRLEADVRSLTERLKTSETDVARLRATTMAAAEAPKTELKPETKPEMKPNFGREARPETVAANRPTADTPPPVVVPPPAAVVAPEPPKASVATSVGGAATGNQRAAFEAGFATAKFALQPMPNGELVAGRPGSYYRIVLTNPATGKAFAFGKERYVLADRDADLIAVAAQLQAKLADALPSAMARTLYVRSFAASAALGQSRTVAQERSNLNRISYLPAVGKGGTIKATPVEQVISGPYQAAHLPVLRSANVRELLLKQIKGANIEIIGADFVPEANPLAHTFELILCVVWP